MTGSFVTTDGADDSQDTATWLFPNVFHLEQYPLLIVIAPERPAFAEIFIHQLAQGYVWNTVGLSHEPAGISVHGANNGTARTWKDARSFVSAKTSYCDNADKLKLVVDRVQGLRRSGAVMPADVEDEAMVAERDYARWTKDEEKRLEVALEEYTEACLLEHFLTAAINVAQMFPPPDPEESTVVQPGTEIKPDQASD